MSEARCTSKREGLAERVELQQGDKLRLTVSGSEQGAASQQQPQPQQQADDGGGEKVQRLDHRVWHNAKWASSVEVVLEQSAGLSLAWSPVVPVIAAQSEL